MTRMDWSWWSMAVGLAGGLLLLWAGLLVALWVGRPDDLGVRDALRLLPDVIHLLRRLATDSTLPRGVRLRLWLLLAYLAMPFDLVPDFIPVIGYADDVVIVAAGLRAVVRHAGMGALERHWRGTPEGLAAVCRVAGLRGPQPQR
ncbi:YkvA family protein [Phycicoccus sp. Soil803]|uniref:YkvA family protein n=1 Tax=Phycicoccus sp. Soil803 TaxID=1736415 RepID=UPI003510DA3D